QFGQWPGSTFTPNPALADGETAQNITTAGWAGEYSKVNVVDGETYVFSGSVATDFYTISNEDGDTIFTSGFNEVEWVSNADQVIRFWTHTGDDCGFEQSSRTRRVTVGIPPGCLLDQFGQWPGSTFTPNPTLADGLTEQSITTSGWAGEYSKVNVLDGETYVFSGSVATDFYTISDEDANTIFAAGEGEVEWVSNADQVIRFWTHTDEDCGFEQSGRSRIIVVGTPPDCLPVDNLTDDVITSTSVDLSWDSVDTAVGYDWVLVLEGEDQTIPENVLDQGNTTDTFVSVTGLDSATSYDFYVTADCDLVESTSAVINFTTDCEVASLNYAEDFEDFLNPCWEEATGTSAGPDSFGFSSWSGAASPQFGSQAARYNMYTNTTAQWMVSQTIDLGAGSPDNVMNFDIAATVWNSTAATTFGPEDEVAAMISTDGGATWVELISFSAGSTPSNTGQNESIDLSSYSGEVQFGFYAISSPETSSDHWVYIDNFYVGTPPPTIVSVGNPALDSYCYDDSEFEEWRFDSDDGSALVIVFEAGSVESSFSGTWDDLIIYDGVDNTGTVLFNSDVDGNELTGLSFTAQSGSIYMTLDSDGSVSCQSSPNIETIEFGVYVEGDEPQPAFANVQVIHNSPDPAAASVDVYLNGALLPALTGVDFRTATSFLEAPAGVDIVVDVVPAGADLSTSVFTETFNLAEDENYIIVANGVLDTSGFVTDNSFELTVYAGAQTAALDPAQVDVLVHHGSPDAPAVDVNESTAGNLVSNIAYPEFQGYLNLAVADYTLEIAAAGTPAALVAYSAPLATLGGFEGAAITVVASGFLGDDASMDNGFGLWVATAAGGALVELPLVEQEPAPMDPAPTPTEAEADVISLFSEAYTDVSVDTWLTPWSSANLEDIQIQGNDTKLYTNLDFAGIETVANPIDATDMDFFHIDVWSPNATTFRVKLVDLGNGATEGELAFDIAQEEWVSLQIPLADFADATLVTDPNNLLTVRNSIQQLIISGLPVGDVTAYVDNVYFSSDAVVSTIDFDSANFSYYPNPVKTSITIDATNNVEEIEVFNM
ncbi:DUF4397 domain-containing protein, partial [Psychroflexus salis]|uniref:DUF4397 domain-containing protein n=1 Tax=Psychroflexus salis TaxID=1526574 RepID=UPI00166DC3A6